MRNRMVMPRMHSLGREGKKEMKMHVRYSQKAGTGLRCLLYKGIKGGKVGSSTVRDVCTELAGHTVPLLETCWPAALYT